MSGPLSARWAKCSSVKVFKEVKILVCKMDRKNLKKEKKRKFKVQRNHNVILVEDFLRVLKDAWIRVSLCKPFT